MKKLKKTDEKSVKKLKDQKIKKKRIEKSVKKINPPKEALFKDYRLN
ncbi:hypothetical protein KVL38_04320 [Helicobacter pylori]|nr:hypothetical protein KVL38_04320 [Helicobacter pylori]